MDPIKKYKFLASVLTLMTFLLVIIVNILPNDLSINLIVSSLFISIGEALVISLIINFALLFILERDVEKIFRIQSKKYEAEVFRKKSSVVFKKRDVIITWSYTGPKFVFFYYKLKFKTKRTIDFDIEWGNIQLSREYRNDDEISKRNKIINNWIKDHKKNGIVIKNVGQGGNQIDIWCISKVIDIDKLMNVMNTIPYE